MKILNNLLGMYLIICVRYHIKNIYTKLHVNSKSEAVAKAIQNKLV